MAGSVDIVKGVLCTIGIALSALLAVTGSGVIEVTREVRCSAVGAVSVGGWGSAVF